MEVFTDETPNEAGVPGYVLVPRLISGTTDPIFSENALITVDELLYLFRMLLEICLAMHSSSVVPLLYILEHGGVTASVFENFFLYLTL